MTRLVVVSNRVAGTQEGRAASGGLAVGMREALRQTGGLWFGWNGDIAKRRQPQPRIVEDDGLTFATLALAERDHRHYYRGFSNRALWPLLHYRTDLLEFERADFEGYVDVNAMFAAKLSRLLRSDDRIWVHDYHLFPLGQALRREGVPLRIGFFLHTPFPVYEVLRTLPRHEEILRWLSHYDVVGFQTETDAEACRDAMQRSAGARVLADGHVEVFDRKLRIGAFPIGVDTQAIAEMAPAAARSLSVERFRRSVAGQRIVIGVDRLDYSKGLEQRFLDYATFLKRHREYRGRVTYLQIAPPTRGDVPEYRHLRHSLGQIAGELTGRYSDPDWAPIRYVIRNFARRTLLGFFRSSRIALVTPFRDGMNLVAKEYVAAQDPEDPGVLILSPFAGAAKELTAAVIANPHDPDALSEAIHAGLRMSRAERRERWQAMFEVLRQNDVDAWRDSFLHALAAKRTPERRVVRLDAGAA